MDASTYAVIAAVLAVLFYILAIASAVEAILKSRTSQGAIAWVMGNRDIKKIRAGTMDPEGESVTNAGRICGIVGVSINAFVGLLFCLYFGGVYAVMIYGMRGGAPCVGTSRCR